MKKLVKAKVKSTIKPVSIFAVCNIRFAPNSMRRISLTSEAQEKVGDMIESERARFVGDDIEKVDFDPTYNTDEESVLLISGFELPQHISEAIATPNEVPVFQKKEGRTAPTENSNFNVKSIVYLDRSGDVYFQCWRHFEILARNKIWLFLSQDTFAPEKRPPLVLDRKIDAVYSGGDLLFKSFANTSSMLEMLEYVSEATAADIRQFASADIFSGNAKDLERCSKLHRRQIRMLVQSDMFAQQTVEELREKAKEAGYDIPVSKGRIVIPPGGLALTDLLRFLSDKIYRGPISGHSYIANSARRRQSK